MIRLPSIQKPYHLFFSGDDAIIQPPSPLASEDEDLLAAFKKEEEEHYAKIRAARQTGDWTDVTVPGKTPVKFLLRPMPLEGYAVISGMHERKENQEDILLLAVRLCLLEIEGMDKCKVETETHERFGKIATLSFLEKFGASLGLRVACELGAIAIQRTHTDPL